MNMHKHMEAIFVVTVVVVSAGSFALDSLPQAHAEQSASVAKDSATADVRAVVVRASTLAQRA